MDVVDLFRSAGAFGYLLLAGGMVVFSFLVLMALYTFTGKRRP